MESEVVGYGDVVVASAIGCFAAAMSLVFMLSLDKGQRLMAKFQLDARVKPAIGACLLAPLLWLQPQTMGLGVYTIRLSFDGGPGGFSISEMLQMTFVKGAATVVSPLREQVAG